ncbi:hypothetical protein FDP41_002985 [Naegleria fowleri]|uniref:Uncharacterized protein n=1 Tax=Naegleria fowleri TaxID=5763 RepID=A0A6A5BIE8_NAEFO|nr:uncharacterized protein FDP41_002985 [Naegleria fowleri]KAF0977663.1 hypothetical protein FDP41_002985 [Naegleria fowleri]
MYEMLLESNIHVLAIKISSDIRKFGKLSSQQLRNSQQKRNYGVFKHDAKMKDNHKEFNNNHRKKKSKKEQDQHPGLTLIDRVVSLVYSQKQTDTRDKDEKFRNKMLLDHFTMLKSSLRETKLMLHSVSDTESIQHRWNTFMNAFVFYEYGQSVCEVLSKYIFQKTTYERWHTRSDNEAYPRFTVIKGDMCLRNIRLHFKSEENEDGHGTWDLYYEKGDDDHHILYVLSMESGVMIAEIDNLELLRQKIFEDSKDKDEKLAIGKITNELFMLVLLFLIKCNYQESLIPHRIDLR